MGARTTAANSGVRRPSRRRATARVLACFVATASFACTERPAPRFDSDLLASSHRLELEGWLSESDVLEELHGARRRVAAFEAEALAASFATHRSAEWARLLASWRGTEPAAPAPHAGGEAQRSASASAPAVPAWTIAVGDVAMGTVEVRGDHTLDVVARTANDVDEAFFALELTGVPTKDQLGDTATISSRLATIMLGSHVLRPSPDSRRDHRITFQPRRECRALLIGAVGGAEPLGVESVRVDAHSALATHLLRGSSVPEPGSRVRRIDLGGDHRRAVMVGAPGGMTLATSPLPAGDFTLRFAVARLDGVAPDVRLQLVVARGGERELVREFDLPAVAGQPWQGHEIALAPAAGAATIEFRFVGGMTGRDAFAVAAPRIFHGEHDAPYDVVLVSLDTVRADLLDVYGHDRETSPNLTALARRGVVFENAISPGSYTLPSHASMLSGQLPDRHGVMRMGQAIDPVATPLLAVDLRAAGYRTVAITGGGFVHPDFGFGRGFDRYTVNGCGGELRRSRGGLGGETPRLDDLARELADRREPLFAFLHTYAAHAYAAPDADLAAVGGDVPGIRAMLRDVAAGDLLRQLAHLGSSEERRAHLRSLYLASLRVADDFLGRVVAAIDAGPRAGRTILIVTSDHGEELFERGEFGHGHSVREELIRVPLLIVVPGVAPRRVASVVSLVDIAATVRELCRLPPHADETDGTSLVSLLRGEPRPTGAALARADREDGESLHALRGVRHKLIRSHRDDRETRAWLFDVGSDPRELDDLAAADAERIETLREALRTRVAQLRARGTSARTIRLDDAMREMLDQLGY
jgi:arylsulfatase A-like enzyme